MMNGSYPGIVMTRSMRRRGLAVWIAGSALLAVAGVGMVAMSVAALANGDTVSTTRVRGADVPTWTLGLIALALVPLILWQWRRESGVVRTAEGLVNIQPMQGGLYLIGNYGLAKGVSVPVADNSPLRIALQKTGSASFGLVKFYGLRMTSNHGDVLMDVRLMPKALDLSPLLADLGRRRIAVDLDPALEARHDHGATLHVPPPSGPVSRSYQAGSPQPAPQPTRQPPQAYQGWNPK
ncbi:MAG: hypothetical protein HGA51_08310 [Demequinaceae bacterium]|nr:hypothetical protein [Demequinaceae bacterium]